MLDRVVADVHVAAGRQPAQDDGEEQDQQDAEEEAGIAAPLIDTTISSRSSSELARTAAITPAGIAITTASVSE